jgi:hypothetical protein
MMECPRSAAASGGCEGAGGGGGSCWWLCSTSPGRLCSTKEYFELLMKAETQAALPLRLVLPLYSHKTHIHVHIYI